MQASFADLVVAASESDKTDVQAALARIHEAHVMMATAVTLTSQAMDEAPLTGSVLPNALHMRLRLVRAIAYFDGAMVMLAQALAE